MGEFEVVAQARDGKQALDMVRQYRPDVVVMDIHMPELDGVEATRQIMSQCPVPVVVASATLRRSDVDHGLRAIEAGAVSVIAKPDGAVLLHLKEIAPELRHELIAASRARAELIRPSQQAAPPAAARSQFSQHGSHLVDAIGICASTGGPGVLNEILTLLRKPFPIPILLVQHISQGFVEGFGEWLASQSGHEVQIAAEGQRLTAGVWLAPTGRHLCLAGPQQLSTPLRRTTDKHCPSGDPLFESLAVHLGSKAAGVQLTGMGRDGANGLLALQKAGGETLIQNRDTCLIWGMPRAARELGAANYEFSPAAIAGALNKMSASRKQSP